MKKLPKIYKNDIVKSINNNKSVTYVENICKVGNNNLDVLDDIFNGIGHSYNIPLLIKTVNGSFNTSLISRNNDSIFTLDNDVIFIKDILSIEILK